MAVRNKDRLQVELRDMLRMGFCRPSLALCYIFPSQPAVDSHGSRGQLIVSFMLVAKSGLAIFGAIATVGLSSGWLALCLVIYNLFNIPFLHSEKNSEKYS